VLDDSRRQDLYAYAAKVVGTAGSARLEALRARRLVEWGEAMGRGRRGRVRAWLSGRAQRRELSPEAAARFAIGAARHISDKNHAAVLGLVDELIALGASQSPEHRAVTRRSSARIEREPVAIS